MVAQEEVCWCGPNTFGTCANFTGRARLKQGEYCLACTEGRSTLNATLCEHWRLVKPRNSKSKQVKAKQLSAEAADVRGQEPQTPSGEVRVGNYDEDKIRSDWEGTKHGRDALSETRHGAGDLVFSGIVVALSH